MSDEDLKWRVESACLAAWPSPRQIVLDGWVVRASGGQTRRANSANALHSGAEATEALIDAVEHVYRDRQKPAIFRITDMTPGIDALLEARGYIRDAQTRTLFGELDEAAKTPPLPSMGGDTRPGEVWLDARDRLSGSTAEASRSYREIIGAILLPCGFVSVSDGGRIVSLAFGAIQDDLLILESVLTDPACRQRGFARQCVNGLQRWAKGRGARSVALQVMSDNVAALALYRGLGIARDLYGYHYRIKPAP